MLWFSKSAVMRDHSDQQRPWPDRPRQRLSLSIHCAPLLAPGCLCLLSAVCKVDNLCRNPPLVVLVPASQEAEPLDITVTLHPRAAQAQPPSKAPTPPAPTPTPPPPCRNEKRGEAYGSSPSHPPSSSPGGPLEPPSPSSLGTNSAAASPHGGGRGPEGGRSGGAACEGTGVSPIASPGAGESRGDGGSSEARQQLAGKGLASTAPLSVERDGVKRRGAFKIPGGGKTRLSRSGSVTPAKTTPPPAAAVTRHIASWDGSQDVLPVALASPGQGRPSRKPGDKRGGDGDGEARASPTGNRGRGASGAGEDGGGGGGGEGGGGGGGGGGIFASLSRRRSDYAGGEGEGGDGLRTKPRNANVPAPLSARERDAGDKGRKAGVMRGGLSSAPPDAQASYKMFFGDTDDGGEESGSSDDDEDGLRPRKSFIRVSCTARTSYKLFSSDPQVKCASFHCLVPHVFFCAGLEELKLASTICSTTTSCSSLYLSSLRLYLVLSVP